MGVKNTKNSKENTFLINILKRLRNPVVITSIISQVMIILTIAKLNVDGSAITKVVVAICSILVSLGIMNNPEAQKPTKTIKLKCSNCGETTEYLFLNGELMCDDDGNPYEITEEEIATRNKSKLIK